MTIKVTIYRATDRISKKEAHKLPNKLTISFVKILYWQKEIKADFY